MPGQSDAPGKVPVPALADVDAHDVAALEVPYAAERFQVFHPVANGLDDLVQIATSLLVGVATWVAFLCIGLEHAAIWGIAMSANTASSASGQFLPSPGE